MKIKWTTPEQRDFARFMQQREVAASAYVRGDSGPLTQLVARTGSGTFFSPGGGAVKGAAKVSARYRHDARSFEPAGKSKLEILHMGASDGLAYWAGFQRATGQLHGMKKPVSMNLRISEVFQRQGGTWKLIHRHADFQVVAGKK